MKGPIVRFVAAYRWELLLFLVVPAMAGIANHLALYVSYSFDSGWVGDRYRYLGHGAVGSLVTAVVLGVCYTRVRSLGRELLALVWGYRLALSVISALFGFASAAIAPSFIDPQTDAVAYALGVTVYATLVFLVSLPVLVVFARRASRLSLTHAFFFFLITLSYTLPVRWVLPDSLERGTYLLAATVAGWIGSLVVACVLAWLLGNFESRGDSFRKRMVLVLLAVQAVPKVQAIPEIVWLLLEQPSPLWHWGIVFVTLVVLTLGPLAFIYLIRDRSPQPLRSH